MFNRNNNIENMLDEYLSRIGYKDPRTVSVETLIGIVVAHSRSIPFENLVIHEQKNVNNRTNFIKLDIESVFDKLVRKMRGGHCLETNELLAFALIEMGFKVERIMGRSLARPNLARGHKMLLVTIEDQKWIADVGFGGHGLFEPIPLILDQEFNQNGYRFQLVQGKTNHVIQYLNNVEWRNILEFSLEVCEPIDYRDFNYSISHDPESFFVTNRICVIATPRGRAILNNYNLKIITDGNEENITLNNEVEYFKCLKEYFGIEFPNTTRLKEILVVNESANDTKKQINTKDFSKNKFTVWCSYFAGDLIDLSGAKNTISENISKNRMTRD